MDTGTVLVKSEPQEEYLINDNLNIYVTDSSQIATVTVNGIKTEVKLEYEEIKTNLNKCKTEPEYSFVKSETTSECSGIDVEDIFNEDDSVDITKLKQLCDQNGEETNEFNSINIKEEYADEGAESDIAEIESTDTIVKNEQQEYSTDYKNYPCTFCDKILPTKLNYDHHLLKYHRKLIKNNIEKYISRKTHKCDLCQYVCIRRTRLKAHYNAMHNDSKSKIKCQYCHRTFARKFSLDDHLLKAHNDLIRNNKEFITSKIHKCQFCSFETTHITTLKIHTGMVHDEYESDLRCNFCPKKFMTKVDLDNHLIKQHKKHINNKLKEFVTSKIHKCTECSYESTHKRKLKTHFENIHSEHRSKVNCKFCSKTFFKKFSLHDHLLKHHYNEIKNNIQDYITSKIHKCEVCSFETTQKPSLTYHLKQHNEFKIKCQFCDKTFVKKPSLDDHLLKQHKNELSDNLDGVITTKVHKCMFCDYKTTRKTFLDKHLTKLHSEVKPKLSCDFCSKTFVHKYSLDCHLLKVHKEKVVDNMEHFITSKIYKCEVCGYQTTLKTDLNRHAVSHGDQRR